MFVVERVARGHRYLYLVESVRDGKTVRQRTIKALGRKDALVASGELDRLAASIARHGERSLILSDIDAGRIASRRIGGPLLFGRLWQRLGIGDVLEEVLEGRQFGFAVERAVFIGTLHRLFVSGSDRDCANWMADYGIEGAEGLALHHFYRAMAWLGEELGEKAQGALVARCVKDVIEESCSRAGRTCSPTSALCSWTQPRCPSMARAARRWASAGIPRTSAPIWRK